ncbi:hypothetical protein WUBG_00038 [Wuchereria bancrofti]|uniref:Uncharacterized protein n=1 Tax=Wuchereria bancrofti TaxID=6293 RepID=J9BNB2_WUCBA|nr:hypothetical protein WUBG_00038 [Wuchereria bancrofti]VDM23144.1 unnamed protein product [Wuchereria bancrofti]
MSFLDDTSTFLFLHVQLPNVPVEPFISASIILTAIMLKIGGAGSQCTTKCRNYEEKLAVRIGSNVLAISGKPSRNPTISDTSDPADAPSVLRSAVPELQSGQATREQSSCLQFLV